jgi:hypothetical protein
MQQVTYALLTATILAAVGCREQPPPQSGTRSSTEWPGWEGDTTIDPAGDVQKLQGKWRRVPEEGAGEMWLTFDGDTVAFEAFEFVGGGKAREPGQKPHVDKYRFVLNSSLDPKVMRYTHRLENGRPLALQRTHPSYNHWYKLNGDTLTSWNHLMEGWTRPIPSFQRAKGEI